MGVPFKVMNRFETVLKNVEKETCKETEVDVILNPVVTFKQKKCFTAKMERHSFNKSVTKKDCFAIMEKNKIQSYVNMITILEYGKDFNYVLFEFYGNDATQDVDKDILYKVMKYQRDIINKMMDINENVLVHVFGDDKLANIMEPYIRVMVKTLSEETFGNVLYHFNEKE